MSSTGLLFDLVIKHAVPQAPIWPNVVAVVFALVLLAVIAIGVRGPRFAAVSFVALNLVLASVLIITDLISAAAVPTWVVGRPFRLGMMAVAVLAPSSASGLLSIVILLCASIVEVAHLSLGVRTIGEPWISITYVVFGVVLLFYRARHAQAEQARANALVRSAAMQQLAHRFLALRDLAHTPLQTVALNAALLRVGHPELGPILDRIERAVEQLRQGTRLMARYDEYLRWGPGVTSFDPRRILEKVDLADDGAADPSA